MANFDNLMGELGEELCGIANYWGIDLGLLVGLNLSYELRRVMIIANQKYAVNLHCMTYNQIGGGHPNTTDTSAGLACTSIVAQSSDGILFHGRNLDWNLPNDIRNIIVIVSWTQFDSDHFVILVHL